MRAEANGAFVTVSDGSVAVAAVSVRDAIRDSRERVTTYEREQRGPGREHAQVRDRPLEKRPHPAAEALGQGVVGIDIALQSLDLGNRCLHAMLFDVPQRPVLTRMVGIPKA